MFSNFCLKWIALFIFSFYSLYFCSHYFKCYAFLFYFYLQLIRAVIILFFPKMLFCPSTKKSSRNTTTSKSVLLNKSVSVYIYIYINSNFISFHIVLCY